MSKWVRSEVEHHWRSVEETDVPWDAGTPVTILPTADLDEALRLLGHLSANEVQDDDGYCFFCKDDPRPDGDDDHAPDCPILRARTLVATHDSKGG